MFPGHFHSWRKKAGLVPLVLACVFTAGWVRSLGLQDELGWASGYSRYELCSREGRLWLFCSKYTEPKEAGWFADCTKNLLRIDTAELPARQSHLDWRWDWIGFHFSSGDFQTGQFRHYMVPYWSIVIPSTGLSAWLLLGNPRRTTRQKNEDSILENRV